MIDVGLDAERRTAIAAVRDACRLTTAVGAAFVPELSTEKVDRSPVTVADLGAQALISLALGEAFPQDPIMGEETSAPLRDPAGSRIAAAVLEHVASARPDIELPAIEGALDRCGDLGGPLGRHWTLDPVDGTKGFLRGGQYAVALALIEDGQVLLGVLGCPNLPVDQHDPAAGRGCVFVAERGHGAWQLPLDDAGEVSEGADLAVRPIRVSESSDIHAARYAESLEAGHSAQDESARVAALLGITAEPLRMDSQVKYAVVARGDAEIYLRLPSGGYRENIWDHAAGALLVTEAGGLVSDADGHSLDFTAGRRLDRNRGIVATTSPIHDAVVEAVGRVLGG